MSFWDYSLESTGRTQIVSIQYQEPYGRAKKPVFMRVCAVSSVIPTQSSPAAYWYVIHNPVDPLHLVDDPHGDPVQHVVRDPSPVSRHEIIGGHRSEGQGVVVGPAIPHDPHRAGVGEHREVLAQALVLPGAGQLLPEDEVRQAKGVGLFPW